MSNGTVLAGIFGDGMVIQRNEDFYIWGQDSGDKIKVFFDDAVYEGDVVDGRFKICIPAHSEGAGFTIKVEGTDTIELKDVCFGEVFLLVGQSNMELPVYRTLDESEEEVKASNYPYIRQYRLTPQYRLDENKLADLPDSKWTAAVPGEIMEMSAVGFFCAKNLGLDCPIGFVMAAQGGSTLEAWMPYDLLSKFGDYSELVNKFHEDGSLQQYLHEQDVEIAAWRDALNDEGLEKRALAIPDDAVDVTLPGMFLESEGDGYTGSMWLYKEVEINEPCKDAFLYVGELVDADDTYINGVHVGSTPYCYPPRKYPFDGSILKKGKNLIAVRLIVNDKNGGFLKDHRYYLRSGNEKVSIEGTWKRSYENKAEASCRPVTMGQTIPTALYTASIKTILDVKFRGAWWYQGESNAEDPYNNNPKLGDPKDYPYRGYDALFKAMVERWRADFGQKLPIVVVEMPDYVNPVTGLGDGWLVIQEMQRKAPEQLSDCSYVHAKDLGQPYELHPQLKSELGKRMAEQVKKYL